MKTIRLMLTGLALVCVWPLMAQQPRPYKNVLRETDPAFFQTEEARRVKKAVHCAMRWFDKYKLTGLRLCRSGAWNSSDRDTWLEEDPTAQPLWARYYDLERCEPFVCDRDGVPRRRLDQIGSERRNGYAWYSDNPRSLFAEYERWATKNDPQNRVPASLTTKGADDCIISGLTVYNNYGTVVEPGNTTHQMAIFGRATRTIVINSNVFADGNDALSLWAPEAGGMYYHADHEVTARWTFGGKWNPEAKIRELWHVLAYQNITQILK